MSYKSIEFYKVWCYLNDKKASAASTLTEFVKVFKRVI